LKPGNALLDLTAQGSDSVSLAHGPLFRKQAREGQVRGEKGRATAGTS